MSTAPKGFTTQKKETLQTSEQFATVNPITASRFGLDVATHSFVETINASVAVEAGTTTYTINATAHPAITGDILRFISGAFSGKEVVVWKVTTNTIVLAEALSAAPAAADTFKVLRHRTPEIDSSGNIKTAATVSSSAVSFTLDSSSQLVTEDTSVPANNHPLPVKLMNASGEVGTSSHPVRIDPTGTTPQPASQSGTWNVTNVSGTVSLPTGASTAAKQDTGNTSLSSIDTKVSTSNTSLSSIDTKTSTSNTSLSSIDTKVSTSNTSLSSIDGKLGSLGQKAMTGSAPVVLASDQAAIPMKNQDGSGNAITSAAVGSNRGIHSINLGSTVVTTVRNDYTSTGVTTGAWVQLVASTSAEIQSLEIFDSSGQTLELGTGAAASETRLLLVFPGGNGKISVRIAASTRISIRAVSASASVGELDINFYS